MFYLSKESSQQFWSKSGVCVCLHANMSTLPPCLGQKKKQDSVVPVVKTLSTSSNLKTACPRPATSPPSSSFFFPLLFLPSPSHLMIVAVPHLYIEHTSNIRHNLIGESASKCLLFSTKVTAPLPPFPTSPIKSFRSKAII